MDAQQVPKKQDEQEVAQQLLGRKTLTNSLCWPFGLVSMSHSIQSIQLSHFPFLYAFCTMDARQKNHRKQRVTDEEATHKGKDGEGEKKNKEKEKKRGEITHMPGDQKLIL